MSIFNLNNLSNIASLGVSLLTIRYLSKQLNGDTLSQSKGDNNQQPDNEQQTTNNEQSDALLPPNFIPLDHAERFFEEKYNQIREKMGDIDFEGYLNRLKEEGFEIIE